MVAVALALAPAVMVTAAYVGYPAVLAILAVHKQRWSEPSGPLEWPTITITIPVYNEEASIGTTIEALLRLDYPRDRVQIVVISDASMDRTDEIVRRFAGQGVELIRLPERGGKSAAENAAGAIARGDVIVNIDATVRLRPGSLEALVRAFQDPTVGVASGRDVSVGAYTARSTRGESRYVGYEMWVRSLETRLGSIVGASGCCYGIRRALYDAGFPEDLSRDFASALVAREHGYRAVSVDAAVCEVPRASTLRSELRRKTRTMARGLATLVYKRHLMNPTRYGGFALMLIGHKLLRWLVYPLLPGAVLGLVLLSRESRLAEGILGGAVVGTVMGVAGLRWPRERVPKVLSACGFVLAATVAGVLAWKQVLLGERSSVWEPTRRPTSFRSRGDGSMSIQGDPSSLHSSR